MIATMNLRPNATMLQIARVCAALITLTLSVCFAADCDDKNPSSLYRNRQMFDLREAAKQGDAPPFFRGVVACAFNDVPECEKQLGGVIVADPHSNGAREARNTLASTYFRAGRYREALALVDAMLAVDPNDPAKGAYPLLAALGRLPEQSVIKQRSSKVALHPWGNDFAIAVSVNGRRATFAFDTGNFSEAVSAKEAKRLGLRVQETNPDVTVNGVHVGVAVAEQLQVGKFQFKNVAFIVFPDDQEPFSDMSLGQRGIIGLPLLLAFRTFRWGPDGAFEFGFTRPNPTLDPNIAFDGQNALVLVEFNKSKLAFGLDTGGETTSLDSPFARKFSELVKENGSKDSKRVDVIGSNKLFESISLPQLELEIGGFPTVLKPAHILQGSPDQGCVYGTVGMDLLKQGRRTSIDFASMTLTMQ
jgi:pentatricopeptide repeat protein